MHCEQRKAVKLVSACSRTARGTSNRDKLYKLSGSFRQLGMHSSKRSHMDRFTSLSAAASKAMCSSSLSIRLFQVGLKGPSLTRFAERYVKLMLAYRFFHSKLLNSISKA